MTDSVKRYSATMTDSSYIAESSRHMFFAEKDIYYIEIIKDYRNNKRSLRILTDKYAINILPSEITVFLSDWNIIDRRILIEKAGFYI